MHLRASDIAAWLRGRVTAAHADGLVVQLGGGTGAAVVAGLCRMAMPDRVVGLMPLGGHDAEHDARIVATHFSIPVLPVDLRPACGQLAADLGVALSGLAGAPSAAAGPPPAPAAAANLAARTQMAALYFAAESMNALVAGTINRCDLTVGVFTKHGEAACDILPIGSLLESDVRALARDLGVPDAVLARAPRPPAAMTGGEEPIAYEDLERYLTSGPDAVPPAFALRIERMIRTTEHKRMPPPVPEASVGERDEW